MPFMTNEIKVHGNTGRKNPHGKVVYSLLSKEEQIKYKREANNKSYLKRVGGTLTRRSPLEMTDELRKEYYRNKSCIRATRAKKARFTDELTTLVVKEAHDLRILRNKCTGIEWHVDHIEPLKGKDVCGLHIWSNLQVIPKLLNLQKGAKRALSN